MSPQGNSMLQPQSLGSRPQKHEFHSWWGSPGSEDRPLPFRFFVLSLLLLLLNGTVRPPELIFASQTDCQILPPHHRHHPPCSVERSSVWRRLMPMQFRLKVPPLHIPLR